MARVGIVTDSGACLRPELAHIVDLADPLLRVVPISVFIDGEALPAGAASDDTIIEALRDLQDVTTSSPSPRSFLNAYRGLEAAGCDLILSVHISSGLSATVTAARAASGLVDIPVSVHDSATAAMSLGFVIARLQEWLRDVKVVANLDLSSVRARDEFVAEVSKFIALVSAQSYTFFMVETLENLHKGGRLGRTALALGAALKLKPLFVLRSGKIRQAGVVRTVPKSIPRIFAAFDAAAIRDSPLDVAITHVSAVAPARLLSLALHEAMEREGIQTRHVVVSELNPALAVHTGPGTLAVAVMPTRLPRVEGPST